MAFLYTTFTLFMVLTCTDFVEEKFRLHWLFAYWERNIRVALIAAAIVEFIIWTLPIIVNFYIH